MSSQFLAHLFVLKPGLGFAGSTLSSLLLQPGKQWAVAVLPRLNPRPWVETNYLSNSLLLLSPTLSFLLSFLWAIRDHSVQHRTSILLTSPFPGFLSHCLSSVDHDEALVPSERFPLSISWVDLPVISWGCSGKIQEHCLRAISQTISRQ
jgi:hypothetical protein